MPPGGSGQVQGLAFQGFRTVGFGLQVIRMGLTAHGDDGLGIYGLVA